MIMILFKWMQKMNQQYFFKFWELLEPRFWTTYTWTRMKRSKESFELKLYINLILSYPEILFCSIGLMDYVNENQR